MEYKIKRKARIKGAAIEVIEVNYKEFKGNKLGRPVRNYRYLDEVQFFKCKQQAIKKLKNNDKILKNIINNNKFKYFLTIRGINQREFKKIFERIRRLDKNLKYVILRSWSIKAELHYHILLDSKIEKEMIEKKLYRDNRKNKVDYKLDYIDNLNRVGQYMRKNINYDNIYVLKQNENEYRDKQIEILEISRILTYSQNIKYKSDIKVIENINEFDIEKIVNNKNLISEKDYVVGTSIINYKLFV